MVSKSCNIVAELDQFDVVVSIGDFGVSLFDRKRSEDVVGCHSKACDVDGAVGVFDFVAVVEPVDEEAWDLVPRCLPVL